MIDSFLFWFCLIFNGLRKNQHTKRFLDILLLTINVYMFSFYNVFLNLEQVLFIIYPVNFYLKVLIFGWFFNRSRGIVFVFDVLIEILNKPRFILRQGLILLITVICCFLFRRFNLEIRRKLFHFALLAAFLEEPKFAIKYFSFVSFCFTFFSVFFPKLVMRVYGSFLRKREQQGLVCEHIFLIKSILNVRIFCGDYIFLVNLISVTVLDSFASLVGFCFSRPLNTANKNTLDNNNTDNKNILDSNNINENNNISENKKNKSLIGSLGGFCAAVFASKLLMKEYNILLFLFITILEYTTSLNDNILFCSIFLLLEFLRSFLIFFSRAVY